MDPAKEWFAKYPANGWTCGYADGYNLLPADPRIVTHEYKLGYYEGRVDKRLDAVAKSLGARK